MAVVTLDKLKDEIKEHKDYKDLDQKGWETKIKYQDIVKRSQKDFDWLIPMYTKKIAAIREQLRETGFDIKVIPQNEDGSNKSSEEIVNEMNQQLEQINYLVAKEARLLDKLAVCLKEVELRKDGKVVRTDIHNAADYYIDYGSGNDANNGLSTGQAWKTITKYTTTTVRVHGDRAFLRAHRTWTQGTEATDINFDEDGTVDDYISIIGCDATTNDPWGDASDVKPIIDFEDAAYQVYLNSDNYWWLERCDFRQSNDGNGCIYIVSVDRTVLKDCVIRDGASGSEEGLTVNHTSCYLDGCSFSNTYGTSLYLSIGGYIYGIDCTIDAGADVGASYGVISYGRIDLVNCSLAPSNAFSSYTILSKGSGQVRLRNCPFGTETYANSYGSLVLSEDHDGVYGAQKQVHTAGIIEKDTVTVRSGGASSSAAMTSNSDCGPNSPLVLGDTMSGFAKVWATKDVEINISVYARVGSAWDSALSASEAYAKFSYLSNGSTAARTEVQSTETIANDTSWTAFTSGNITPLQTGFVYIWFNLAEYEDASENVYVDIKPVVTTV